MNRLRNLLKHTLPAHLWRRARYHYQQRYVLPQCTEAVLEGVQLDISRLSLRMKDAILSGTYESPETTLCREVIRPGAQILELGGAIGYIGLYCLKHLQASQVVSVEPNPRTVAILRNNYRLNGRRPQIEEFAIASRDGELTLNLSNDFWEDNLFSPSSSSLSQVQVEGTTLRSLINRLPFDCDVLISDTEGAETLVDWGDLPSSVNTLVIELHPGITGHTKAYSVLHAIMARGFVVVSRIQEVIALKRH